MFIFHSGAANSEEGQEIYEVCIIVLDNYL